MQWPRGLGWAYKTQFTKRLNCWGVCTAQSHAGASFQGSSSKAAQEQIRPNRNYRGCIGIMENDMETTIAC